MASRKEETRRGCLNIVLGAGIAGWLGSILYPVVSFLRPPEQPEANVRSVAAATVDGMAPNSREIIKFGRSPVILIRLDSGESQPFTPYYVDDCRRRGHRVGSDSGLTVWALAGSCAF